MKDEADEFFNSGRPGVPQAGVGGGQSTQPSMPDASVPTQAPDPAEVHFAPPPATPAPTAPAATPPPASTQQPAQVADAADEFFNSPAPTEAPPQMDDAERFFNPEAAPESVQLRGDEQPQMPTDAADQFFGPQPERPGYVSAYLDAAQRGIDQLKQITPAAVGMYAEWQGHEDIKQRAIAEIQRIERDIPQRQVGSLADINNFGDFTYWATETFGEQTPILVSMMASAGVSGLVAGLVGKGFFLKEAKRQAVIRTGQILGGGAAGAALETSGIATELQQSTGSFHSEISLPFGIAAGALEMWMPVKLLRQATHVTPSTGIGRGFVNYAAGEGGTEFLQEVLATTARELADPNYEFFSKGTAIRLADATAAGVLVGGTFAGGIHAATRQDAGEDRDLTPDELAKLRKPTPSDGGPPRSAMSWLREKFARPDTGPGPDGVPADATPVEDFAEMSTVPSPVKKAWRKVGAKEKQQRDLANFIDDVTPRYAVLDAGGNSGNRILNATGLEEYLALQPAQDFQPRIVKIDTSSMQPGGITAELFDLPTHAQDPRVYYNVKRRMFFLPGMSQAEKAGLEERFNLLVTRLQSQQWQTMQRDEQVTSEIASLQAEYESLVNAGLRVMPTPGASFHYAGFVDGEMQAAVPTSDRSMHVARVDSEGILSSFDISEKPELVYGPATRESDLSYVAVDLAKVSDDLFVDGAGNPVTRKDIAERKIHRFKLAPGKTMPRGALVPGIGRPGMTERAEGTILHYTPRAQIETAKGGTITNLVSPRFNSAEAVHIAGEIQIALKDILPVIEKICKRFNMRVPEFIITDGNNSSSFGAYADVNVHAIGISILGYLKENARVNFYPNAPIHVTVAQSVFHELGHLFTIYSWGKLPAGVQQQVIGDYQRALLKWRIQGRTEHLGYPMGTWTSTDRQIDYNLTFIEYLAEQFRRWAVHDVMILNTLNQYYHQMGVRLEEMKAEAREMLGEDRAKDLYQANYGFNLLMEYLEQIGMRGLPKVKAKPAFASSPISPILNMAKGIEIGDYPMPIELEAVRAQITAELARFRRLLTDDMQVEVGNEVSYTERGGQRWTRFGQMDDKTRTLRILAGSLALNGEKDEITRVIAHEIFHGIQDVLTKAEATVLVEAGRRAKVLSQSDLRNIIKDINQWMEESGYPFTEAEKVEVRRYVVDNEYMAVMAEMRSNGMQVESIVAKILDHIIQTAYRIASAIRGLGYISSEDVIRAFYRGEYTARYNQSKTFETRSSLYTKADMNMAVSIEPARPILNEKVEPLDDQNFVSFEEATRADGKPTLGTYLLKAPDGTTKGFVEVSFEEGKGYAIDNVVVARQFYREGVPMKLYQWLEKRFGETPKPNGILTKAGYRALQKINPMLVANYVYNSRTEFWLSPNMVSKQLRAAQQLLVLDKRFNAKAEVLRQDKDLVATLQKLAKEAGPGLPTQYSAKWLWRGKVKADEAVRDPQAMTKETPKARTVMSSDELVTGKAASILGYHGTKSPLMAGEEFAPQQFLDSRAIFFGITPKIADTYAGGTYGFYENGAVYRYVIEAKNPLVIDSQRPILEVGADYFKADVEAKVAKFEAKYKALGLQIPPIVAEAEDKADAWKKVARTGEYFGSGWKAYANEDTAYYGVEQYWKLNDQLKSELQKAVAAPSINRVFDAARKAGHDVVVLRGVIDIVSNVSSRQTQIVALDKNSIKLDAEAASAHIKRLRMKEQAEYVNELFKYKLKGPPAIGSSPMRAVDREGELTEVVRARDQQDAEAVDALTGSNEATDEFGQATERVEQREREEAARELGIDPDMAASSQADNIILDNIFRGYIRQITGRTGQRDPQVDRNLTGRPSDGRVVNGIRYEADRISWFSKIFFGLHQVAWRNEGIPQMRRLLTLAEQMNAKIMQWVSRADATAKEWDKLPERQRNALSEYMFWLTEMNYRSAAEVAANVVRHPTMAERQAYVRQHRIGREALGVAAQIEREFADYLTEVERISIESAHRTFAANPAGLQAELANIAADMNALRSKPYFPMTRFGQYTVTVRDVQTRAVEAFYCYATLRERDAAVRQIALQYPISDLSVGRVPEEVQEFMGLPAPLLRMIKTQLPGMTPAQSQWFDQLSALMAPERSFRKRWLERKGTPGYSIDGIRVFSAYFRSGARYLGRIEYKDAMQQQIEGMREDAKHLRDGTKRYMLADYSQRWLNYVMEGGRDWGKLKSLISIFQLGGSVAAAVMNITQVPLATYPYLAGLFGDRATLAALKRNADVLRPTFAQPARGSADYLAAREEAVAQGKIEAGQAVDLGAFAEYDNLSRTYAGTAAQRAWRQLGYWSMILFSGSEQFNREWTFKTAYELALQNKTSRHFRDIAATYASEILDLGARRNLTPDQATAFLIARRAIDQTQLIFQPWARPTFLRSGFASTLQIFFSYTQGMLYLLGNSPGAKRMWFGLLAMYGLAGLPGSDDLDKIIRFLARYFMGKDFSPHMEARKLVREMTRGTMFDQVGPDLALHGISRYSLIGVGLLPEGWGIPRFDASANGSMGQIIPGLSELMRGAANNANWKDITADVARDAAGAGFGQVFAMMQFLSSPPMSSDAKKWERVMPRSVKAASKAIRYAWNGREETNQGGTLAKFDMRDPDDVATVISQFLGFTPAKVSEKWASLRATQDVALWYETRKMTLYAQLDVAIRQHIVEDQRDVIKAMVDFNKELVDQGYGSMGIKVRSVVSSLRNRARTRAMQDADLPVKRSQIPLTRQMLDLYPGVLHQIEQKKVK